MVRSRSVAALSGCVLLLAAAGTTSSPLPQAPPQHTARDPDAPSRSDRARPAGRHGRRQGGAQRVRPRRRATSSCWRTAARRRSATSPIGGRRGSRRPSPRPQPRRTAPAAPPRSGSAASRRAARPAPGAPGGRPAHGAFEPAAGPGCDAALRARADRERRPRRRRDDQRQRRRVPGLHRRCQGARPRDRPPAQPLRARRGARPPLPDRAPGGADRPRRRRGAAGRDRGAAADRRLPGRGDGQAAGLQPGPPDGGRDHAALRPRARGDRERRARARPDHRPQGGGAGVRRFPDRARARSRRAPTTCAGSPTPPPARAPCSTRWTRAGSSPSRREATPRSGAPKCSGRRARARACRVAASRRCGRA